MQSRCRTSERQYCKLCWSITKDSSAPTRPPGRLSYCMVACPSVHLSVAPQTQTLKRCTGLWCSQAQIEAKTQASVQLCVVHLFIEPSLPHGMAALMNPTYVEEQIRALEADLCLCVVTVSEYICSGICCGSHESRVELPLQMKTAVPRFVSECSRNVLKENGRHFSEEIIPFILLYQFSSIYYIIWSVDLWIVRGLVSPHIISTWTFVCWSKQRWGYDSCKAWTACCLSGVKMAAGVSGCRSWIIANISGQSCSGS